RVTVSEEPAVRAAAVVVRTGGWPTVRANVLVAVNPLGSVRGTVALAVPPCPAAGVRASGLLGPVPGREEEAAPGGGGVELSEVAVSWLTLAAIVKGTVTVVPEAVFRACAAMVETVGLTVRVKGSVASGPLLLEAVIVTLNTPDTVGVPLRVAVPSPL